MQNKTIYVKLKNNMGTGLECNEFTFSNAEVVSLDDAHLTLVDATGELLFRCMLLDVERFVKFN